MDIPISSVKYAEKKIHNKYNNSSIICVRTRGLILYDVNDPTQPAFQQQTVLSHSLIIDQQIKKCNAKFKT